MTRSHVSVSSLPRSLTALETWGFGFSGLLLWLGTAPAIYTALGAKAIWVWLPGTIVGILLNLQVKQLGQYFLNVAGGTPNYTSRLLQQFPALARYSAIGYLLGWVSVPAINAVILTDLIQENLNPLGISCPVVLFKLGFAILPFVVAFSGIRTLSILHSFFVFPAIGFLTTFCLQGVGWLSFSPASPGLLPDSWTGISAIDWMKYFFIATFSAYSCETASSFIAESRQPSITLRCLSVTAGFIPIIYVAGFWVVMRLANPSELGDSAYLGLITAASPFWGALAPALVTFLITSGCLLSSTTAVSNCPRILYQLAIDGYLPPVFSVVSRWGVPEPSLVFTLFLSFLCLLWGNVTHIVMVTGTGYLLAIMATHLGLWLGRQRPEARWPWWSLGFLGIETAVLVIGGLSWGWQKLFVGVLLPFGIGAITTVLPRLPFAPCHANWWQQRYQPRPYNSRTDWIALQVIILIVLVCSAVSIGWLVRAGLDRYSFGKHMALFSILLMTVAFIGVAIACWTTLSQIAIIAEAQKTVEQTFNELQQQTQQTQQELRQRQQAEVALQQLNRELEQRVQERTQQFLQENHLRQQAEVKFQKIFHASPHAIAIASLHDRRIVEINEAFCQLFGYIRDEMVGHYADEFTLFANPADQGIVQRHLMENGSVRNLECVYWTRTGEARTGIASAEFIDVDETPCFLVIANDITERKRAEAALQQSEARFQKIAAASPAQIYILVTDLNGSLLRFEYVSPATWELRELSPEQLLQDPSPAYDQIHPDDRAGYFAARNHSLATMELFFHEYRIVLPSGQVKWVRVNSRPERQGNSEIYWYGIILDVSDRRQAEQALQDSQARFSGILEIANDAIISIDANQRITLFNQGAEKIFGYTAAEVLGQPLSWLLPERFAMSHRQHINVFAHSNGRARQMGERSEIFGRRKDGSEFPAEASISKLELGSATIFTAILRDISDRRRIEAERQQVEEALRQSEERWQLAIRGSNEGIWDWDIKTDNVFRSDRFYEILGLSRQDLGVDEQSWVGSIHPEDVERVIVAKQDYLSQTIPVFEMEYRRQCQDSTYKWVLDRAIAVWDEQGNPIRMIGSMGDIDGRKQIEQQLRTSLKEKEVLLREVYHRVKNNMQLVSSLLNLQADTVADPTVLRLLNESQQRVKTMALIHERLYRSENLARINTTTYIRDLVNNLILSYKTTDSSIRVNLDVAELELDLDVAVPCSLIINELISNALKYAFPDKRGEIQLQFWLDHRDNYCLIIKDNGIGIPAHIDLQSTETLGIQLVYGLTEQLDGTIDLDRREGSQFRISFKKRH